LVSDKGLLSEKEEKIDVLTLFNAHDFVGSETIRTFAPLKTNN
jgi:hypothetical protein